MLLYDLNTMTSIPIRYNQPINETPITTRYGSNTSLDSPFPLKNSTDALGKNTAILVTSEYSKNVDAANVKKNDMTSSGTM